MLHAINGALLFLILRGMTGAYWRSLVVAALFALHPLRVESVAWVSERKDVLSTLFWMLTVWAYLRYAEEFKVQSSKFKAFYGLSLLFFVCGLMSKPMLVTLPVILLLLDYWPLQRMRGLYEEPLSQAEGNIPMNNPSKKGPPLPGPLLHLVEERGLERRARFMGSMWERFRGILPMTSPTIAGRGWPPAGEGFP